MITVYGIPNCDVIRKALQWFKQHQIKVELHDYKKLGISKEKLTGWCTLAGWQTILNNKSTTWRELPDAEKEKINSQDKAISLMIANTSMIKRPLIEYKGKIIAGFNEKNYEQNFKK